MWIPNIEGMFNIAQDPYKINEFYYVICHMNYDFAMY